MRFSERELYKCEGKAEVTGDLGDAFNKALEESANQAMCLVGAKGAFAEAAKKVEGLFEHVDNDFKAGKLSSDPDEVRALLKTYVRRSAEICRNLSAQAEARQLVQEGKTAQLRQTLEIVKRHHKSSYARVEQMLALKLEEAQEAEAAAAAAAEAAAATTEAAEANTKAAEVEVKASATLRRRRSRVTGRAAVLQLRAQAQQPKEEPAPAPEPPPAAPIKAKAKPARKRKKATKKAS